LLSALDLWCLKVQGEGDFIPLRRVMVISICLSWNVLLGFLLFGIVRFSSSETRWTPMLGGIRKLDQIPRTQKRGGAVTRSSAVKTGEEIVIQPWNA
jgi:hypothetical protein